MSNGVKAWSFSRWEMYDKCAYMFKGKHLDKMPEVQSPAMARGDRVHKGAAKFITEERAELPRECIKFDKQLTELALLPKENVVVEQQWGFTREWKATGWFDGGKGTTWLRVVLDAGVVYSDHTADVVDHKTGKIYDKNAEQRELNGMAMLARYPHLEHVTSRMWYLDSGEERLVEIGRHELDALKTKWEKRVAPMFTDTVFAPRPGEHCRWCFRAKSKGGDCRFG